MEDFYIACNAENSWQLTDNHKHDNIISLKDEYKKYWRKIISGENFALTRYGDGERSLMLGKRFLAQEGWRADNGITRLGADLKKTLGLANPKFVYAVSCPCCDSAAYYWYLQNLEGCTITFANLFVNANFPTFWQDFQNLERDTVLITNYRGYGKKYGRLNTKKHYIVNDDCVKFWEEEGSALIQKIIDDVGHEKNLLYAVSAGPMSGLIIKALFENNPDNCYIDFGSALDICTHSEITRPYMVKNSAYANKNCWMFDRTKVSFDVDVVLSAYKRPHVLPQQLEAVQNQTLKPRRIFLYQDAVKAGEPKVIIDKKILSQFDAYEIATENGGVWKRFEYAAKKTLSPYVCVFDDDTIPGQRWLENCHMQSTQRGGVYGTNGMILAAVENYPSREKDINVGWHTSSLKTFEVDFVGHSWFIHREYLKWMLDKPYKNRYKYVGEDMCLSYACLEHGVKTYVPAHPPAIQSLWGTISEHGFKYGADKVAVSSVPENINAMTQAVNEMHRDGWRILADRNPAYINSMWTELEKAIESRREFILKSNIKLLFKILNKKPVAFIGDKANAPAVKKLFSIVDADYSYIGDENGQVTPARLESVLRPYALNMIFIDTYSYINLKNFLENAGLKENENFIDGRIFFMLN